MSKNSKVHVWWILGLGAFALAACSGNATVEPIVQQAAAPVVVTEPPAEEPILEELVVAELVVAEPVVEEPVVEKQSAAVNTIDQFAQEWAATLAGLPEWQLTVDQLRSNSMMRFASAPNGVVLATLVEPGSVEENEIISMMLFVPAAMDEGNGMRALSVTAASMHPNLEEVDLMIELSSMAPPAPLPYAAIELAGFKVCRVASEVVGADPAFTIFILQPPASAAPCDEGILTGS